MERTAKWLRKLYNKSLHSVAFFPALIMVGFIGLAIITLQIDKSGIGQDINRKIKWLTLKEVDTATTIVATVAAGIISLTVFSFSMVMIVLNQAASQMSNRLLDHLIGSRFQKLVLSFYIGTIVFSFILLSNIGDGEGQPVPVFSVYFLILLVIVDIFLFVSFLHYITQSIRYEQLVQTVHEKTTRSILKFSSNDQADHENITVRGDMHLATKSGYFQNFRILKLLAICTRQDLVLRFLHVKGEYVLKGTPLFIMQSKRPVDEKTVAQIHECIDFYTGQEIAGNPYYGFIHLKETGLKALSPAINDPGTAVFSLNALADLLQLKMEKSIPPLYYDKAGNPRILIKVFTVEELFVRTIVPVWDYGRRDRTIQFAMLRLLEQLLFADRHQQYTDLFNHVKSDVLAAQKEMPLPFSNSTT